MKSLRLVLCSLFTLMIFCNHAAGNGVTDTCSATTHDILGPYYLPNSPALYNFCKGDPAYDNLPKLIVQGFVYDQDCQRKIHNSTVEIWQANHVGSYENGHGCRGFVTADSNGFYRYHTIHPGKYTLDLEQLYRRPSHIHYRVTTSEGHHALVTQMYFDGDTNLGENDGCSVCKSSRPDLIVKPIVSCTGSDNSTCTMIANFDIYLKRKYPFTLKPTTNNPITGDPSDEDTEVTVYPHLDSDTMNDHNLGCALAWGWNNVLLCLVFMSLFYSGF